MKNKSEQSKVGVRNHRRDMLDAIKKSEKDKEISEDEKRILDEEVQELVDQYIKKIDEITKDKEKELLTV